MRVNNQIANQYVPSKPVFMDLKGQRFGRWVVVQRVPAHNKTIWLCRCDCGTEKPVEAPSLRRGFSTSCGCLLRIHGDNKTRLHQIWQNMLNRCRNPNVAAFKNYGGRGIKVCDEWKTYTGFRRWASESGYSDTLTIERNDVNGNYEPTNCSWLPLEKQSANRRSVRRDEAGRPWVETAKANGIDSGRFNSRVRRGWSELDAATKPPRRP